MESKQNFPTKPPSKFPTWDPAEIFNQNNFYITQLGSIPKFPSNHPWVALISYPFTARAELYHKPPAPRFTHFIPREHPSTHPTYHPSYFPAQDPCTRPTQTESHIWAISGRLCNPTGHTVLIFQAGPLFRFQPRMPVPDTVVNSVVHRV